MNDLKHLEPFPPYRIGAMNSDEFDNIISRVQCMIINDE